ncbi:ABC transporter ATP-binding protein [candidate division TA06 bacterium]|uniref:ABC transporter ATP-binding protein n=1 Tax=candidate division TA06 bacterium TaxID=2250710 RepID=A0A523UX95_UNCT6|nr:MAG: ABC transporter ATP-binding protein [candidate division TA06 bacterium]
MNGWGNNENLRQLRRFLPYLRPWWKYGLLAGGLMLITVLLQLPLPLLTRYVIDYVFPQGNLRLLTWIIIGLSIFMLVRLTSGFFSGILLAIFREHVLLRVQLRLFEHIEHLSLSFHDDMKVGYLISRIGNDASNLQGLLADTLLGFIRNTLTFCVGVGILFFLHWKLALVSLAVLPCFIYSILFFSGRLRRKSGEMQENIARVYDVLGESLSGISVVKSFGAEKTQAISLLRRLKASLRSNIQYTVLGSASAAATAFLGGIGPLIVLWYGGREVITGALSLGTLIAFNAFLGYLYGPVRGLMGLNTNIQTSLASLRRVFELFDLPREEVSFATPSKLTEVAGSVSFQNITFSYDGNEPVLKQVSLKVEPGEKVALIGRSGAGKTSLVNLIPRFYEPKEGEIYIDGTNIKKVELRDLRSHIGIVPQDTFIFAGSIKKNIQYGRTDASDEEITAAAKAANAYDFIAKLPANYDTEVGERGVKLSGGERQRIAIARAMLKNPRILILDEATSEVDSESERLIQAALDKLMKDRTTFVIAHRLSTILNADKIFVIDKGKIMGGGKHEELYETLPLYRKLYREQFERQKVEKKD